MEDSSDLSGTVGDRVRGDNNHRGRQHTQTRINGELAEGKNGAEGPRGRNGVAVEQSGVANETIREEPSKMEYTIFYIWSVVMIGWTLFNYSIM